MGPMNHVQCTSPHTLELRASTTTGETAAPTSSLALWGGGSSGARPGGVQDLALVATRAAVHVSKPCATVVSQGGPGALRRPPGPHALLASVGGTWGPCPMGSHEPAGGAPSPPCGSPGRQQRAGASPRGRPLPGPRTETTKAVLSKSDFLPRLAPEAPRSCA